MKKGGWIVAFVFYLFTYHHVICQDLPHIKKKRFKLDPAVNPSDFQEGILYVKLKPEYISERILLDPREEQTRQILNLLEVKELNPFAHPQQIEKLKTRARKIRSMEHDIRSYQQVIYNYATMPLEEAVNLLYETGMFEIVEPAWINRMTFEPDDSLLSRQYYLDLVKTFEAWEITQGSEEVVIAIVDSGIDRDHPDIVNSLWYNEADPVDGIDNDNNGYVDDYRGWDFGGALRNNDDEDNDPMIMKGGSHSHGTGVGGVIGATVNNRIGLAGIANKCKVLFTKHMADDMNDDELSLLNTYSGILYAASLGVDVINCSWGSNFRSQIAQDVINFVVEDLDIVVVAAAGNTGRETDDHYPSAYDNVLSVSAVDARLNKASFTTYGKTVDITAPGSGIAVLEYNNVYGIQQGTSFSSPIVAAAAALVRSHRPELTAPQVSELLRVTANDTIYDVNTSASFKNKLGKGILDIEKALIDNPPSVRLQKYRLLNSEGKTPGPGEGGFLVATFKNYLWPSTGGMRVRLTSKSALLQVVKNESILGSIEMNQEVTNLAEPFEIRIAETVPPNTRIDLQMEFNDGSFYDYQFLSVLLNPTFLNIEENLITSTIAENGRLGFQDTDQTEGLGFVYDEKNILYEMGLILGAVTRRVSNNVRSAGGEYDNDFFPLQRIQDLSPGLYSASEIVGSFNDSLAASDASDVEVRYRTMVWKEVPNNKYFIIEYTIYNRSAGMLEDFHAGLFADWDLSEGGQADRASWYEKTSLGYVYNLDTVDNSLVYSGIQSLTGNPNYFAIDNDENNDNNPFGIYDGFTNEEKFLSISSGIGRAEAGTGSENGTDVSHSVGTGPYTIAPDDSIVIAFAIHGASTLEGLMASSEAADTMYNYTLKASRPIVPDVTVCYENAAMIQASGAGSYKWYHSKTGGESFHNGDVYTTGILTQDTMFYVSNADNSWESVRTPVKVFLKANPKISLSGSRSLCDNDTLTLIVEKADTYFWNPGNENTQTIRVNSAGTYSVTVKDTTSGCESTSEDILVQKFSSPMAIFEVNPPEIDKNQDIGIVVTDQSVNAMKWFWQLSDGTTSNDQNPTFTVNTEIPIKVNLTITADNGCQDTSSVIIDVITDLEDEGLAASWIVYPNPNEGILLFELRNNLDGLYRITIYSPSGKIIANHDFLKSGIVLEDRIDLTGLSWGIYLIRMEGPNGEKVIRRILIR
ncbi:MAG: S8 family serine peptidase [Cyclobacteriaceae bacterium]|nr:S8 family serine peptidase [Cyclobacteriaceae bacterium]